MFGTDMRIKNNVQVRELIEDEWIRIFNEERDDLRTGAREKIAKIQDENRRTFNKKRKEPRKYVDGDMVAIKRTQSGLGLKFRSKFLGPYQVVHTMRNDRYVVEKIGDQEGPQRTSTAADFMKPWLPHSTTDSEEE
ncbi:hypothetical protein ALC62_03225 [Cyphomyrmex costatus]|uniref:Uncharacterized protein n=1 Tax=Cyphomyrmex costatus TaxID=456900 RepID=A0A151ILV0_9HYME|nr:hypothetical protein ALC62_03225 [Cyphomyrmex costatus]